MKTYNFTGNGLGALLLLYGAMFAGMIYLAGMALDAIGK